MYLFILLKILHAFVATNIGSLQGDNADGLAGRG